MAQKSLPTLNKINVSMVWYTTFYEKHYKWLSMNLLILLFFYIKILCHYNIFSSLNIWKKKKKKIKFNFINYRFFYPVTCYIVDFQSFLLLYNFFYKTSIEKFQFITDYTIKSYNKKNKETAATTVNKLLWRL